MRARREKMAEKKVPTFRCTSCLQSIPEDQDQRLFAGYRTRPKSDDVENFIQETATVLRSLRAIAEVLDDAQEKGGETLSDLHYLISELAIEGLLRLDRAETAANIVRARLVDAEKGKPGHGEE
jgi:hypothetical protein